MSNALISVIVPVYNVEKYVEKCLCSLLAQSYENTEIIRRRASEDPVFPHRESRRERRAQLWPAQSRRRILHAGGQR